MMNRFGMGFLALAFVLGSFGAAEAKTSTTSAAHYQPSPINAGLDIQYGRHEYDNYRLRNGGAFLDDAGHSLRLAVEWLPLQQYGKFGIGAGAGFFYTKELGSEVMILPLEVFISYRADFLQNQFVVPYGRLGLNHTLVTKDDSGGSGVQRNEGLDWAVGLEFLINLIDPSTVKRFDQNVGVNKTYVTVEYAKSSSLGDDSPDLSYEVFRFGLRFEM